MNPVFLLSAAADWLQRLARRWREARRAQRDLELLSTMSEYELRDLGITHASAAAELRYVTRCE
ncbi:hypothetical protein [Ramlibacter sp. PS4R-6]|uniref:hypothetical protein n=1 Tax=Ramlibacter sp. PS4R-6 TaxID=3133438 RepID=UPI0030B2A952